MARARVVAQRPRAFARTPFAPKPLRTFGVAKKAPNPFGGIKAYGAAQKKLVAIRRKPTPAKAPARPAPKKTVLRLVKKPAAKTPARRTAPSSGGGGGFTPMPAQDADDLRDDEDESPSESEAEPAGPDDEGESSEDSGSDSEGDEPSEGDDGGEGAEGGDGEDVGALIDLSNIDPGKAVVLGWVIFGVTLSGAMAIGWALGRKKQYA